VASVVTNILRFKRLIDREELPPLLLRNTIPICMAQYERLFSTNRYSTAEKEICLKPFLVKSNLFFVSKNSRRRNG